MILIVSFSILSACSSRQPTAAPAGLNLAPKWLDQETTPGARATPPSLAALGLRGRLLFIQFQVEGNRLVEIDLANGQARTIFQAPENAWLASAALSPDGRQIVLAYGPPTSDNRQVGYTGLYLIPYEKSGKPEPLLEVRAPMESYAQPCWSPDGNYIYYAHLIPGEAGDQDFGFRIERSREGGEPEIVVEQAYWPQISPDGAQLAYLTFDPAGENNELYIAGSDGRNPRPVLPPGAFPAVDAHLFSPDGTKIYFSAVNEQPAQPLSWLDRLLGVEIARAHTLPSDWYTVPVAGGPTERITHLKATGLSGALSPDGNRLAFISDKGLLVVNVDGQDLLRLVQTIGVGTVEWIE
jgi:Tol biopolymer transport system component